MAAKCPKCEKAITSVRIEDLTVKSGMREFRGVAYACPHCASAISVSIDPVALKTDTVKETVRGIRGTYP